jgi:Aldehyde dehydrogenase family
MEKRLLEVHSPLLLGGKEFRSNRFELISSFYPDYSFGISHPGPLEISRAIGAVRKADVPVLPERIKLLQKFSEKFTFSEKDVEHCVRLTGMPIRLVRGLFDQIPSIIKEVSTQMGVRFRQLGVEKPQLAEPFGKRVYRMLVPRPGFCYAITPGNDPRAAALVAANLAYLGIPFILRASIRDTAAQLVIKAMIAAGFDPRFCNLIYLDRNGPQAAESHARLATASSVIWTFGPAAVIEPTLRYQPSNQDSSVDLFEGKTVLQHASGNCAAVTCGPLTDEGCRQLYASIGYPIVCTATKSVMVIDSESWIEQAAEYLHSLVIGDPLDPECQVGYIEPKYLDYLESLREKTNLWGTLYGGERISPFQAAPMLVASEKEFPDFFAREIPAYVLAARPCKDLDEAIQWINHYTGDEPRLAVSFLNFQRQHLGEKILSTRAHILLVGKPTTTLVPTFHEGNDYALLLSQDRYLNL